MRMGVQMPVKAIQNILEEQRLWKKQRELRSTKEHIYKRQHAAEAKISEYMNKQTHEFVVCTNEAIHYVHPDNIDYEESDF